MKRIIALLTLIIMLVTSLPMSLYVYASEESVTNAVTEEYDYIYYSELFYSYPHYLKNNTLFAFLYQKTPLEIIKKIHKVSI